MENLPSQETTSKQDKLAMVNFDKHKRFNITENGDLEVMLGNDYKTNTKAQANIKKNRVHQT